MTDNTFNGWANYETWNVALYIQNEYALYQAARNYSTYDSFIPRAEIIMESQCTPDGVRWMDPIINTDELDEMLQEL